MKTTQKVHLKYIQNLYHVHYMREHASSEVQLVRYICHREVFLILKIAVPYCLLYSCTTWGCTNTLIYVPETPPGTAEAQRQQHPIGWQTLHECEG